MMKNKIESVLLNFDYIFFPFVEYTQDTRLLLEKSL